MGSKIKVLKNFKHYSQYETIEQEQNVSCGATSLAMVMNYICREYAQTPNEIKEEVNTMNGYIDGIGVSHEHLIFSARNYGYCAYREEFDNKRDNESTDALKNYSYKKLKKLIDEGIPVIISMNFKKGSHLTVLIGYKEKDGNIEEWYFADPEKKGEEWKVTLNDEEFKNVFRYKIIVVYKHISH